jgi:hypothetical protein
VKENVGGFEVQRYEVLYKNSIDRGNLIIWLPLLCREKESKLGKVKID